MTSQALGKGGRADMDEQNSAVVVLIDAHTAGQEG